MEGDGDKSKMKKGREICGHGWRRLGDWVWERDEN